MILTAYVFSVKRGLCILLKTPSNHLYMVDCGRDPSATENTASYSPATWIAHTFRDKVERHNGKILTQLLVTHPHDDHVEDIGNVIEKLPPAILLRHKDVNWTEVLNPPDHDPSANTKRYHQWQLTYSSPLQEHERPDFGCSFRTFALSQSAVESISMSQQHQLNNRSFVLVATVQDHFSRWKIVICGDNEEAGLKLLLTTNPSFVEAIANTDVLVTPHHGYESGYCPEFIAATGKPLVNISSTRRSDDFVSPAYSEMARGIVFDNKPRKHLTTRTDGHIVIMMDTNRDGLVFNK